MKFDYDVVVVGGGPGGSTAARYCAQSGLKTVLFEKEVFPRDKPCGGCLSIKTVRLFDFDLAPVIENTIYGAKFTYCLQDPFLIESGEPMGFMVMREQFDLLLVERAKDKGAEVRDGKKIVLVEEKGAAFEVEMANGERLCCEYLIGADGPGSVVSKSLPQLRVKRSGTGIGLESEVPFDAVTDFPRESTRTIHLDFGRLPNGYGWVFPKKEGLSVGVGGIFEPGGKINPRQHFNAFLKELGFINEEKIGKVAGHPLPCFYGDGMKISHKNALLVGDAGRLMDPLTGEGIYYAIQSGRLAAEAIIRSKEEGIEASVPYQASIGSVLLEDLKWARHVSKIIYGFTKFSYRTLKLYPELGNLCLRVLAGETSYQRFVVTVKERMKTLVKGSFGEKIRNLISKSRPA